MSLFSVPTTRQLTASESTWLFFNVHIHVMIVYIQTHIHIHAMVIYIHTYTYSMVVFIQTHIHTTAWLSTYKHIYIHTCHGCEIHIQTHVTYLKRKGQNIIVRSKLIAF